MVVEENYEAMEDGSNLCSACEAKCVIRAPAQIAGVCHGSGSGAEPKKKIKKKLDLDPHLLHFHSVTSRVGIYIFFFFFYQNGS